MAKRKKEVANAPGDRSKWDEKKWQSEQDVETLARAFEIKKDPERMKRAKEMAKEKLEENKAKKAGLEHVIDLGQES